MEQANEQTLTTEELAERWKIKKQTLYVWRQRAKGPKFVKLGDARQSRVFYRVEDVESYEREQLQSGTADRLKRL